MGKNTKLAYATLFLGCLAVSAAQAKLPVDQVRAVEQVAMVNDTVRRLTFLNMPTETGAGTLIAPTAAPVQQKKDEDKTEADALRLGGILPVPSPLGASQTGEQQTGLRAPTEAIAAVSGPAQLMGQDDPAMSEGLGAGGVFSSDSYSGFSHRNRNHAGDVQTLDVDDRTRLKKIAVPHNKDPDPQGTPQDNS